MITAVDWQGLEKVAVLYDPQNKEALPGYCEAFIKSGFRAGQLWPIAKACGADADIAELQTHCVVLDEAQRQGWRNVLLLDAAIQFAQDESLVSEVNQLLTALHQPSWHVLLLSVRYDQLASSNRLPGSARLHDAGCAYAVNACYYAVLQNAYRRALEHSASIDRVWTFLMEKQRWLGLSARFARR